MVGHSSVIPDTHLAAMGHVANMIANLEFAIDVGIWRLVGVPQQITACLTAQMISAHPRLKAFIALVEVLGASSEMIGKLNTFSGDVSGLVEKRNRLLHDPRMIRQRTGQVARLQITAKPKVHFGFIDETDSEVNKVGNDIGIKVHEFIALRDAIIAELATLREKGPPQLVEITPYQEPEAPTKPP
jgi:hypothetical protein